MKKQTSKLIPLLATGIVPTATLSSAMYAPLAMGAPGDLDPAFGVVGRLGPILNGPAWSLEPLEDGSILLAGGDLIPGFYYWGYYVGAATNFINLLSETGSTNTVSATTALDDTQVLDIVRQPGGQIIAVGRKLLGSGAATQLTAFRLQADGALDTTFGSDGIFELALADDGNRQTGSSVLLDPDERIVVAGSRDDQLIVLRLLPNGSLDDSFATSGIFAGPETFDFSDYSSGTRTSILRTATGGYRVTASNPDGCQVVALTAEGGIDDSFGNAGVALARAAMGNETSCNSMAAQADGRILVAGSSDGQGFATRLLADGAPDPDFTAPAVSAALTDATALASGPEGSVVVAGTSVSGATIMRLQASGELDVLFGNAGSTLIDLQAEYPTSPAVHDMFVRMDGRVVAAGGEHRTGQAFVVQLLGDGGGNSPGVLSITEQAAPIMEDAGEVVVNVRRTGGAAGSVGVTYRTANDNGDEWARAGQDYASASGFLSWMDGDTGEQQIRIPILSDTIVEQPESFLIELGDTMGGPGVGTTIAAIEIAADGSPSGQFNFWQTDEFAWEYQTFEVGVSRDFYGSGAVSIMLTPVSGTATAGEDFLADPVTLSWADGETGWKSAEIPIVNDTIPEPNETFIVQMSDPTGGAIIGPRSVVTVQIQVNDQPPRSQSRPSNGGGAFGYLSVLVLGFMSWLRRARAARFARPAWLAKPDQNYRQP